MQTALWTLRRVGVSVLTLLGVSILIFASVRLMPGDYADLALGPLASDAQRQEALAEAGLEQPVVAQFGQWLLGVVTGDLGHSYVSDVSVGEELARRLPVTATIAVAAIVLTVLLGLPLGLATALRSTRRGGGAGGRLLSAFGISVPEFVLGGLVVFLVSSTAIGLSVGGYRPPGEDLAAFARSLLLPTLVLAVACSAVTARNTRDAVLNVLVEPHIAASVARGESPGFIVRHHIVRNAMPPVLTLLATIVATLLGGTVIVETIFNVPGIGAYLVTALGRRDYLVVQAVVLLAAIVFIVANLVVDLVATALDPRLRAARIAA
ncbi:ABC transporter permease [Jiangella alkaliphila]|uniref:Peptide/nickel transport system permease protein n=1 Tax=Jiangella alkaliphila TaxID=419479 RepID=A0A1H2LCS3_9ACTN|nr:ABC transporter permease [Jiangella alkaliphila]SDU78729.1 peptide/nickel transport system permease protein [Jiangella alkaliphila]